MTRLIFVRLVSILILFLILHIFFKSLLSARASTPLYTCPLQTSDITGVMQWEDGFPFSSYSRNTHELPGIDPDWQAVDVNGYFGSSVYAATNGIIIGIEPTGDQFIPGGNSVTILGDDGSYYQTAHVTNVSLNLNQRVNAGDPIGQLISYQDAIQCDINHEFTSPDCTKVHIHIAVYSGQLENPTNSSTLTFLSQYCGLDKPISRNAEFPDLPTINCAKITGNSNIGRCFMQKSSISSYPKDISPSISVAFLPTPSPTLSFINITFPDDTPTQPNSSSCDMCGWCNQNTNPKPPNWDSCMDCLYEDDGSEVKSSYYTVIGCLSTRPEYFVNSLLSLAISIAGGTAFLSMLYGSLIILTSKGYPEKLKIGKDLIASSIFGLILIIFSVFLLRLVGYQILKIPGFT